MELRVNSLEDDSRMTRAMPNNSVEGDGHKLRLWFPPPSAPATPHVKR